MSGRLAAWNEGKLGILLHNSASPESTSIQAMCHKREATPAREEHERRVNRQWGGKAWQHDATGTMLAVHQNLKEQADMGTRYTRWKLQEWNLRADGILGEKCFSWSSTMSFPPALCCPNLGCTTGIFGRYGMQQQHETVRFRGTQSRHLGSELENPSVWGCGQAHEHEYI